MMHHGPEKETALKHGQSGARADTEIPCDCERGSSQEGIQVLWKRLICTCMYIIVCIDVYRDFGMKQVQNEIMSVELGLLARIHWIDKVTSNFLEEFVQS
jgi:hypothetical protein